MRRNKAGLPGLLLLGMLVLAVSGVWSFPARTNTHAITFKVPAGQKHETRLQAGVGYLIEFRFDSDSDINVSLYDPHGLEVGRWHRLDSHAGVQHIAEKNGVYVLRFDNSFSVVTSKRVSVTMRVVPPRGR